MTPALLFLSFFAYYAKFVVYIKAISYTIKYSCAFLPFIFNDIIITLLLFNDCCLIHFTV